MLLRTSNLWALLLLLVGVNAAFCSRFGPNRMASGSRFEPVLTSSVESGQLTLPESGPGKFQLPDVVIEEKTEEEDSAGSHDDFGFLRLDSPFLPTSPAPSAILAQKGDNASLRVLRITCLRC